MAKAKKSENVPQAMQEKFDRITALTDAFSQQHLNDEYGQLIRLATAALGRKKPSPLASGTDKTWACGITHALGMVNFVFDSSQKPHVSAKQMYDWFGVAASTGQAKSKLVRDILKMRQMDVEWCLPSRIDQNPMAWMVSVNGYILDARSLPRVIQEEALAKGLIPYLPGEGAGLVGEKPRDKRAQATPAASADRVYVLNVFIVNGPVEEKFAKKNPVMCRTIEIAESQTLAELHQIIFEAFDREEEHMYEFQVGGQGPQDPNARRYGLKLPPIMAFADEEDGAEDVAKTTIAAVGLSKDEAFGYWFDFGDDWWHQINVVEIGERAAGAKYPRITKRVGKSPPQYADL
jgi:hypothetical protein